MKKIFLLLNIVLLLFPATYSYAQDPGPAFGIELAQPDYASLHDGSNNGNLYFEDDPLDLSDDDVTHSERKILPFGNTVCNPVSFVAQHFSDSCFKRIRTTKFFFYLRPSLFIFLMVFRL